MRCGHVCFCGERLHRSTFSDVPKSRWAYTFVEKAAEKEWAAGMGDGTFAPDKDVTYSQSCVMLVRAFCNDDYRVP